MPAVDCTTSNSGVVQTTFLGASISSFSANVGWNGQPTTVTALLVEDSRNNDRFSLPNNGVGSPVTFTFGAFSYRGILQRYVRQNSIQGNPLYEVTITSPHEVLDGTEVILNDVKLGLSSNIYQTNVVDPYGYYERQQFGLSDTNDTGMPWNNSFGRGVKNGILGHISNVNTINFKGTAYTIDFSNFPSPPPFYRLGGTNASLATIVNQVLEDSGYDYITYLDGNTIKFKLASRINQTSTTYIDRFITANSGVRSNSNNGIEFRNDYTDAVLIGGQVTELYQTGNSNLAPFWGFDTNGDAIIGVGNGDDHTVQLNATPIQEFIGSTTYECSVLEMRFALIDQESWQTFIAYRKPVFAQAIGLYATYHNDDIANLTNLMSAIGFINVSKKKLDQMNAVNDVMGDDTYRKTLDKITAIYRFIANYADEYYGKKFVVSMSFISEKLETDTGIVRYSYEPTDAGYATENAEPIGLFSENAEIFTTQDGRYTCFVKFTGANIGYDPNGANVSILNPQSAVAQDTDLFLKASVDPNIIRFNDIPSVVITLDDKVEGYPSDEFGDLPTLADLLQLTSDQMFNVVKRQIQINIPLKISPRRGQPDQCIIPLQNNLSTYGPWVVYTEKQGKVLFRQDPSLVPWEYGGYDFLNAAANASLVGLVTGQQEVETGTITMVGPPTVSIGDALVTNGPNVTGIDVSVGTDGITTTYSMQTYTPRFGAFSRLNADRIKRFGLIAQQQRRSMRQVFKKFRIPDPLINAVKGARASQFFYSDYPKYRKRNTTPHSVFIGSCVDQFTQVGSETLEEALAASNSRDPDIYTRTAIMGVEGLLRPFSTDPDITEFTHFEQPLYEDGDDSEAKRARGRNVTDLNPFCIGNDMNILMFGSDVNGFSREGYNDAQMGIKPREQDDVFDEESVRGLALRGPLIITSWGWNTFNKPVPNENPEEDGDNFIGGRPNMTYEESQAEVLRRPDRWKTGPFEMHWSHRRKCWGFNTFVIGKTTSTINAYTSSTPPHGTMKVYSLFNPTDGVFDDISLNVYNWFRSSISNNTRVIAGYLPEDGVWVVISADC